ncbi:retrovirus-related pol polyprotein from transposon TNT 1-94 [Tanacetum coccineum]
MNQVLSENERLLAQAIDNDIVKTVVNLSLNEGCETVNECQRCLELKTELLNKKDFVDKETYDKLCKSFTTLEKHCITLEADSQLNQENFQLENSEEALVLRDIVEHAVSTGSPSSTTVDQDAPSPSNSHTTQETQTPIISHDVEEDNHDIEVAHMGNDPYFGIPIPEVTSDQSSSSDVIHTIVPPDHQVSEHNSKWTKDHPLENIIGALDRPVSTRLQLHEQALFCYYDAFLTSVEPKNYKEALTQACWIEAMQEELHEFECLEVWELVPPPDKAFVISLKWIYKVKLDELGGILKNKARLVARGYRQEEGSISKSHSLRFAKIRGYMKFFLAFARHITVNYQIDVKNWLKQAPPCDGRNMLSSFLISMTSQKASVDPTPVHLEKARSSFPRGIFINQAKYALESLTKYGYESCDPLDTPWEKSKLDEDKEGNAVDPSHYRGMIGTLLYLTASRPDLQFAKCCVARYQVSAYRKAPPNAVKRIFLIYKERHIWFFSIQKDSSYALTHLQILIMLLQTHAVATSGINTFWVIDIVSIGDIITKALGRERIEISYQQAGMAEFYADTLNNWQMKMNE